MSTTFGTKLSYSERAAHPACSPFNRALFNLAEYKKTNLVVAADVKTKKQLYDLIDKVGPHVLGVKTHVDLLDDFDCSVPFALQRLAEKHGVVIFEDCKARDIGDLAKRQVAGGVHKIATFAHVVNAHALPGPLTIQGLSDAFKERKPLGLLKAIEEATQKRHFLDDQVKKLDLPEYDVEQQELIVDLKQTEAELAALQLEYMRRNRERSRSGESLNSIQTLADKAMQELALARGVLVVGEMSSSRNLLDAEYARKAFEFALEYPNDVVGFIAQKCFYSQYAELQGSIDYQKEIQARFAVWTPGVSLEVKGDALGQNYNDPSFVIKERESDVIIVGRGIYEAADPKVAAQKYQEAGWSAYLDRIAKT